MTPEQIKTEADRIVYLHWEISFDEKTNWAIPKTLSTQHAILHVQGQIDTLDKLCSYWVIKNGEWYKDEHQKLQSVLSELKSRV